MASYQKVRMNPYSDETWNDLRVRLPYFHSPYLIDTFQAKLARCTVAFDRLELEMDTIYEANVPIDLRLLRSE